MEDITLDNYPICESCIQGKMTKASFLGVGHRAVDLLEVIYNDVCGPLNHAILDGSTYFVTFTDDKSRYGYVYLMRHKSEILKISKYFETK